MKPSAFAILIAGASLLMAADAQATNKQAVIDKLAPYAANRTMDDPLVRSLDCLGLLSIGQHTSAISIGENLLSTAGLVGNAQYGWGLNASSLTATCDGAGTFDAFQDGTCNASSTRYTLQTSLAGMCLVGLYEATNDPRYLNSAKAAADTLWRYGQPIGVGHVFLYSDNPNDSGRYVRNASAMAGAFFARVGSVTGLSAYLERAYSVGQHEMAENIMGNFGYLETADPQFSWPGVIENHLPYVAVGMATIGAELGSEAISNQAQAVIHAWQTCMQSQCQPQACSVWSGNPVSGCKDAYSFYFCGMNRTAECNATLAHYALKTPDDQDKLLAGFILWQMNFNAGN